MDDGLKTIDIIIPSFHSRELTLTCLKSFEKFSNGFDFNYYVVENSENTSYKEEVVSVSSNVNWIQNPTNLKNSEANAIAVEVALEHVNSEHVFICHNDVVACHENWMKYIYDKLEEEKYSACGYVLDNDRINALHISGLLTTTEIAKSVSMYPVYEDGKQVADVGDLITEYIRENGLDYFSCRNTHNDNSLTESCPAPYNNLTHVDRALNDDNEVIFLHLGRGTPKTFGTYWKDNRLTLGGWLEFTKTHIFKD